MRQSGYATGAAVSCYLLRRDRGLSRGFDFYDDDLGPGAPDERAGEASAGKLRAWLDTAAGRPLFAFLHLYEPHAPYAPPEPFAKAYASNPYDGEIAAADAAVGRLLEDLKRRGLYDRAIVILVSDHGEGLNDHGEDDHGVFLYREAIRVPLIVKLPGSRMAGSVIARPVGLCDVAPTVSALLNLRPALPGVSLLDSGGEKLASRAIYSESLYPKLQLSWSDLASLTDSRHQYIEAPRPELYDLQADPREKNDLAAGRPEAFRTLRIALSKLPRPDARPGTSSPEELKRLASLGYIRMAPARAPTDGLPDPKDKIASLRDYKKLLELFYAKRDAEAIGLARQLLAADPGIFSAWRILAQSLARSGRLAEAVEALRAGIDRAAAGVPPEEAGQASQELARLLSAQGAALAQAGRLKEAREALTRALDLDPKSTPALTHLANLSLREKDAAGAKSWAEKAIEIDRGAASAWSALGAAQAQLNDEAGARESWSRAVAEDPTQYDALFNLGVVNGRMGRVEEARRALERFLASAPADRYEARRADARKLLASLAHPARP